MKYDLHTIRATYVSYINYKNENSAIGDVWFLFDTNM